MKYHVLSFFHRQSRQNRLRQVLLLLIVLMTSSACASTNNPASTSIFEQQPNAQTRQASVASQEYAAYVQQAGIMGRFDAQETGFNPYEHTISSQNISQLHPIWSYQTGSVSGQTGMVSANGMLYLTVVSQAGTVVVALDEKTGQRLWQYHAPENLLAASPNDGPLLATSETVYVALSKQVCAIDAYTGQQRWCSPVDRNPNEYLIESELTYADHILYLSAYQTLIAFDAQSGQRVWSYWGAVQEGHILIANRTVYVGESDGYELALDAHTGAFLWSFSLPIQGQSLNVLSSPVIAQGIIYIPYYQTLYALDARTGRVLWSITLTGEAASAPAVANGLLYLAFGSQLQAFDLTTHRVAWSRTLDGQGILAAPFVANHVLYVSTITEGNDFEPARMWMYGIGSQTGQILRTFQRNDQAFQVRHIFVADGYVYVLGNTSPGTDARPDLFALGL